MMKHYKKIKVKPYIYGFTILGFFGFAIGTILALLSFIIGFTFIKLVFVLVWELILYLVMKYVISNDKLMNSIFDEKLPKTYSKYE
jgi:hypothetical protein